MESKFTPGPWRVERPLEGKIDERPLITAHDGKTLVAEILQPLSDEDGPHRGEYDCRLIAAAPELLSALEEAVRDIQELCPGSGLCGDAWTKKYLPILAKAKGGAR